MVKRFLYQKFVELTNGRSSSYLLNKYTSSSISKKIIPSYKKVFSISDDEWNEPVGGYRSLQDFFTRQLAEGKRTLSSDAAEVISPVDGTIEYAGTISEKDEYTVKGITYSLEELLGSKEYANVFSGGEIMVLYLSPANYHRIHAPVTGTVGRQWVFGRYSYPVNQLGLKYGDQPLAKNYRMVTELTTAAGQMAFVKVGAMFVNSIQLTNTSLQWNRGEEVGYFRFGSTVIIVAEKGTIKRTKDTGEIKMGERIAQLQN